MRILLCSQAYYRKENGQAVFTIRLAEGLVKAGHDVLVIVPSDKGRGSYAKINGVLLRAVPTIHIIHHINLTLFSKKLVKNILIEFHPDIIHIQDFFILSHIVLNLARQLKVPIVSTNHFQPLNWIENIFIPQKLRLLVNSFLRNFMINFYNRVDAVCVPTKTATSILHLSSLQVPVRVISCGVDPLEFYPRPKAKRATLRHYFNIACDKTIFLYVGRIDHDKGLDCLLRAAKLTENINVEFIVVGKGLFQKYFSSMSRGLGLSNRVIFLGYVPAVDLPLLYNCADALILPSLTELQSITTLEGMSCGLPVLAANAGALPELVENNINGFLFKPGDPMDLANKINLFLTNSPQWDIMGLSSRQRSQSHDISVTIIEYINLYKEIIVKRSPD